MHKLVLDTNVIVSGIISKSYPYQILHELVAEQHVALLLSPPIVAEYREVLSRDKFGRFPAFKGKADRVLTLIRRVATMHTPDIVLDVIKDKADNRFLELAVFAGADYIVTGNSQDFTLA